MESARVLGAVLVGCGPPVHRRVDELDSDSPAAAAEAAREFGYHDRPLDHGAIKRHCNWILHFHSADDDVVSVEHGRLLHAALGTDYVEHTDRAHYMDKKLPELVDTLCARLLVLPVPPS